MFISTGGDAPDAPLKIVGVVGIGHTPGIIKLWPEEQRQYVSDIMTIPPPSLTSKILKFSFKISLLGFGGYIIYRFVPVPKVLREHVHLVVQKAVSTVRINPCIKYSLD